MFKIFSLVIMTLVSSGVLAAPVILFSDLSNGPNSGWSNAEPNKGVAVTIWGKGFGTAKGSNYVSVNGNNLVAEADYPDGWGQINDPVPWLQRITFHLNSNVSSGPGSISITVNGVRSNPIPFVVRSGNIYFTNANASSAGDGSFENPWRSPASFFAQERAGDTLYFRGGLYDQRYLSGHSNLYLIGQADGSENNHIALVGYPGETAVLDSINNYQHGDLDNGIYAPEHYAISRLTIRATYQAIQVYSNGRVVGNDLVGNKVGSAGVGILDLYDNDLVAFGNAVHGADTGSKQDHAIYVKGCADEVGAKVAYNYAYDNRIDRGPVVVINHQQNRCPSTAFVKQHHIYSNLVDCTGNRARGIAVYDLSWHGPPETEPEAAIIFNNIVYNCGRASYPAMYTNAAHSEWYNNIVYNGEGVGLEIMDARVISTKVKNNIFHMASASAPYVRHVDGTLEASNNLFHGGDSNTGIGSLPIFADPALSINPQSGVFSISSSSPAIDSGVSTQISLQLRDFAGTLYGGSKDIGAIEFYDGISIIISPPSAPTFTEIVKVEPANF